VGPQRSRAMAGMGWGRFITTLLASPATARAARAEGALDKNVQNTGSLEERIALFSLRTKESGPGLSGLGDRRGSRSISVAKGGGEEFRPDGQRTASATPSRFPNCLKRGPPPLWDELRVRALAPCEWTGLLIGPGQPDDPDGRFHVLLSERNPTALFGAARSTPFPGNHPGRVNENHAGFPESGGALRAQGCRIGRFGWKAQKASLHDFVLAACAIELGLNVPGEAQFRPTSRCSYKHRGMT